MKVLALCVAVGLALTASTNQVSATPIYTDWTVTSDVISIGDDILIGIPDDSGAFLSSTIDQTIPTDTITAFSEELAGGPADSIEIDTVQGTYAVTIPEPVALLLLGAGLAAVAAVRRRKAA